MVEVFGIRAAGSLFRVFKGSGDRLGFRVWGVGSRAEGLWCRFQGKDEEANMEELLQLLERAESRPWA